MGAINPIQIGKWLKFSNMIGRNMWKILIIILLISNAFADIKSLLCRDCIIQNNNEKKHVEFKSEPQYFLLYPLKCNGDKIKIEEWDFDMYFCKSHIEKLCKQSNQGSLSDLCELPLNEKSSYYIADILDSLSQAQLFGLAMNGNIEIIKDKRRIKKIMYVKKCRRLYDEHGGEDGEVIMMENKSQVLKRSTIMLW